VRGWEGRQAGQGRRRLSMNGHSSDPTSHQGLSFTTPQQIIIIKSDTPLWNCKKEFTCCHIDRLICLKVSGTILFLTYWLHTCSSNLVFLVCIHEEAEVSACLISYCLLFILFGLHSHWIVVLSERVVGSLGYPSQTEVMFAWKSGEWSGRVMLIILG
jgi:hypothetical protein